MALTPSIETNHMLLAMQLFGRIAAISLIKPCPPWPSVTI